MKNVLVKVSGDLFLNDSFIHLLNEFSQDSFLVVIVGGGTQINKAFKEKGYAVQYNEHGRVTGSYEERRLSRRVLEDNQMLLLQKLQENNVSNVKIEIPFITLGSVLCPVNGDEMVKACYKGFDDIVIVTTDSRVSAKEKDFTNYPSVRIVGL